MYNYCLLISHNYIYLDNLEESSGEEVNYKSSKHGKISLCVLTLLYTMASNKTKFGDP